jgi:shikimate kinase
VPVYREVATVEIVTDDRTPSEIVEHLVAELAAPAEAKE